MKNEFMLAFNEIAEERKLSKEVIIEALEAALVSAYRRNTGVSSAQLVEARIDQETGNPTILAEKEVVEGVQDARTEVELGTARLVEPDVEVGDMVMVDSTPENFGRIAAQTAKQVILQRMREAERSAQYEEYRERVGDLLTGTVQSIMPNAITVGLGRTEAILPRSQQMAGERYRTHDKVRAYVMEVTDSPRGPQIVLSRAHRNMLRRLLEYEVPEIYNGTVEIKNIAREPGARSKVAVFATREGVDPVGACVGMRGVRIQSIVRELNDEKIDVIEWNSDQAQFIARALSPARVNTVYLDDDPLEGRTAIVVVPDDQLSLAIGRAGQNARLAAKLTGWRIDIKSITEAASDALLLIQEEHLAELAEQQVEMIESIERIIEKKEASRPIMPEDYQLLAQFTGIVENHRLELLQDERQAIEAKREAAREQVPPNAYLFPLDETSLPLHIYNILTEGGYKTFGDLMEQMLFDEERLLKLNAFGEEQLDIVKDILATDEIPEPVVEEEPVVELQEEVEEEVVEDVVDEVQEVEAETVEGPDATSVEAEATASVKQAQAPAERVDDEPFEEEEKLEVILGSGDEVDDALIKERDKTRRRQLVFDEEIGEVVSKRRRKASRQRADWGDIDIDSLDELDEFDDDDDDV